MKATFRVHACHNLGEEKNFRSEFRTFWRCDTYCVRDEIINKWKCTTNDMLECSSTGCVSRCTEKKGSSLKPITSKFLRQSLDYTQQTTDKTTTLLLHRDYFYSTIIIIAGIEHCFSIVLFVFFCFFTFSFVKTLCICMILIPFSSNLFI